VDGVLDFTCTCDFGFSPYTVLSEQGCQLDSAVVGVLGLVLLGLGFLAFVSWQKQKKGGQQVSDEQGGLTLRRVLAANNSNISPEMQRLQAKLDAAIATQDFEEAARVKKMMDAFQAQKGRRDELQAKLNAAIAAQDFEEAARVKRMLDAFSAQSPEASVVAVGTAIGQI
jgi:excinuclease UvrABC nuclease subunit